MELEYSQALMIIENDEKKKEKGEKSDSIKNKYPEIIEIEVLSEEEEQEFIKNGGTIESTELNTKNNQLP